MRDLHEIEIVRAALHIVAPRTTSLVTTEEELPLPLPDEIAAFLGGHVERGLADSQASAAKFVTPGLERAQGASDQILDDPSALVEGSGRLARLLYDASSGDERVSDGTLAALLCRAADKAGAKQNFVSLLKLDPSSQYRTKIGTRNGRRVVSLEQEGGILPSVDERLQKAVFIRKDGTDVEYRMLLLDRQRKGDIVSDFFLTKFLGAELVLDATKRTEILWRSVTNARNSVQDDLQPTELLALDRYIHGATSGTSINLDTFGEGLPIGDDEIRGGLNAELSAALRDREFDLDEELTQKLHRRRIFEGDNGLRITVNAEHFESMVDVGPDPERPGCKVITIRTGNWNERA
jgi:hypothetical protein